MKLERFTLAVSLLVGLLTAPLWAYAADNTINMVLIPGKGYEIGKYEVTQGQWKAVMGNNPSKFGKCGDNCPVEAVSWDDIQIFLGKLNAKTGKLYRLPSDAEWEHACYGGSESEYCGGNVADAVAWTEESSNGQTHAVGKKRANGYGLHDMSGNVWEWTNDCAEERCVLRGGSWKNDAKITRATDRNLNSPDFRCLSDGFRLARTVAP